MLTSGDICCIWYTNVGTERICMIYIVSSFSENCADTSGLSDRVTMAVNDIFFRQTFSRHSPRSRRDWNRKRAQGYYVLISVILEAKSLCPVRGVFWLIYIYLADNKNNVRLPYCQSSENISFNITNRPPTGDQL